MGLLGSGLVLNMYKTAAGDTYGLLKSFARENRRNQTEAESVLWTYLRCNALGVKFLRQHILGDYIGDFVSTDKKIVIEVDGGYHLQDGQIIRDANRTMFLEQMGYTVVRFSNEEVLMDTDNVIIKIKEIINNK